MVVQFPFGLHFSKARAKTRPWEAEDANAVAEDAVAEVIAKAEGEPSSKTGPDPLVMSLEVRSSDFYRQRERPLRAIMSITRYYLIQ